MIELLLQAERTMAAGRIDEAERLYRQAADADPRSSIAVVGLARVALERGNDPEAWRQGRRALEIDPENVAAQRLTQRLEEVYAYKGESIAAIAGASAAPAPEPAPEPARDPAPEAAPEAAPASQPGTPPASPSQPAPSPRPRPDPHPELPSRGLVDRLLRRKPR